MHDIFKLSWSGANLLKQDTVLFKIDATKRITASACEENSLLYAFNDSIYKIKNNKTSFVANYEQEIFRKIALQNDYLIALTDNNHLIVFNRKTTPAKLDTLFNSKYIWENIIPIDDDKMLLSTNKNYYLLNLPVNGTNYSLKILENRFILIHADYIYADEQN